MLKRIASQLLRAKKSTSYADPIGPPKSSCIIDQHGNYEFIVDAQHKEAHRLKNSIREFACARCVSKASAKPKVTVSIPRQIPVNVLEEVDSGLDNAS